jgi:hypothetical protein
MHEFRLVVIHYWRQTIFQLIIFLNIMEAWKWWDIDYERIFWNFFKINYDFLRQIFVISSINNYLVLILIVFRTVLIMWMESRILEFHYLVLIWIEKKNLIIIDLDVFWSSLRFIMIPNCPAATKYNNFFIANRKGNHTSQWYR